MNKKYILVFLLFLILVIGSFYISKTGTVEVKEVFAVSNLKSNCTIKKIEEKNDKYTIDVFYPETEYKSLNTQIINEINAQIEDFRKAVKGMEELNLPQKFQLNINFDSYEYNEYISFVFNIFLDTGGAHPNTYSYTITFDTKNKKVVTIEDLADKNKDILKILSDYTYNVLKDDTRIKEYGDGEMLKEGTYPYKENFSKFAFDKDGLKIIFDRYSVAPYVAGAFSVTVPYEKLGIK